jgi:acyl-CoA reductase-like NAD-dependent aldehyde dehydrogenase
MAATVGDWLVTGARGEITFTGSPAVGDKFSRAGIKSDAGAGQHSPVIIAPDADLDFVAKRCAVGAYYNSDRFAFRCNAFMATKITSRLSSALLSAKPWWSAIRWTRKWTSAR